MIKSLYFAYISCLALTSASLIKRKQAGGSHPGLLESFLKPCSRSDWNPTTDWRSAESFPALNASWYVALKAQKAIFKKWQY